MLKRFFIPLLIPFALGCNQPEKKTDKPAIDTPSVAPVTVASEQLITPGESIGHLFIKMNADSAIALLGRPDSSDAAMGSAMMTWYSSHDTKGYKTSVFAHRNMGGEDEMTSRIKQIMVTSPWFKTIEGISTGKQLSDIKKYYTLKPVENYAAQQKKLAVYNDDSKGIAFDVDSLSGKCVAITIHAPGAGEGSYINMH